MITVNFKDLKKSDLQRVFEWLALPHIAQWWRESRDFVIFSTKYKEKISADYMGQYIIEHEGTPIGYVQWSQVATHSNREVHGPLRTYGFDIFIADLDYVGKGYGTQIILQFINSVLMPLHPNKIITDPEITNIRAIRAYEKAGFRKTKVCQTTDGTKLVTAQIMELEVPTNGS
jgi:aminoglycoside 6'-N-acetyltransferase